MVQVLAEQTFKDCTVEIIAGSHGIHANNTYERCHIVVSHDVKMFQFVACVFKDCTFSPLLTDLLDRGLIVQSGFFGADWDYARGHQIELKGGNRAC